MLVDAPGGKKELVVSTNSRLLAFDLATGKPLWNADGVHSYVCPSVTAADGVVFALGGSNTSLAVRAGGRGDVTESHGVWRRTKGSNVSSPVYHEGHLYWTRDGSTACCQDPRTGEMIYEERLSPQAGRIWTSPLLADGKLYYVSQQNGTYVVAAQPKFQLRRGWLTKCWTTRAGHERGGQPFDRTRLYRLLTNVAYLGKVRYKDEVHPGEHAAIVDATTFERVQALLRRNGGTGGAPVRNQFGALLKGLLRCACCASAMTPTHTTRGGNKRYRYYACVRAQKRGAATCPSRSIPAAQIEGFVVEQIRCIGRDPTLLQETLAQARRQDEARLVELERRTLEPASSTWRWASSSRS